jgi:hypothetical protein
VKSPEVVAVNNDKNAFVFGRGKPLKANLCIWNDKNVNDSERCLGSRRTTNVATLNKSVVGKSGQKKKGAATQRAALCSPKLPLRSWGGQARGLAGSRWQGLVKNDFEKALDYIAGAAGRS